ncbi:hypothetical protein, partial [Actinoalloteichus spitiensis]|uniref:hypothetical protein n=1 Tax=Actinoalloteichus spitiensis TaxID=252394 RepID=UPI001B7FE700
MSAAMAAPLGAKPAGELPTVVEGDMLTADPPARHGLIYLLQAGSATSCPRRARSRTCGGHVNSCGRASGWCWRPGSRGGRSFVADQHAETSLLDASYVVLLAARLDAAEQVISQQTSDQRPGDPTVPRAVPLLRRRSTRPDGRGGRTRAGGPWADWARAAHD